jgi:hypothetical protein
MGVNRSKSAHFILYPLPATPIFASKSAAGAGFFRARFFNIHVINHIEKKTVIDVAKPSKKISIEQEMAGRIYPSPLGEES